MPTYDFTEADFAPKSKFDFTEEDFKSPPVPPIKRNALGESKADLESKKIDAIAEGNAGALLDKAINAGMWGAYLTPLRPQVASLMNIPQPVAERGTVPLIDSEKLKETVAPLTQSMGLTDPVTQGITEFGAETASQLSTPQSIETMATGPLGARIFQAQMIKDSPQAIQNLSEAAKTGDIKETVKAGLGAAMAIGGPLAIESGLAPKETKPVTEPVTLQKEENASTQQEATTLHGNVLSQPVEGEGQVPTKESEQGVQPKTEGGLSKETLDSVGKSPTAEQLLQMTPEQSVEWKRANQYGPEVSKAIAEKLTPDEAAKLDAQRKELQTQSREIIKTLKADDNAGVAKAMTVSLKAQTLREIGEDYAALKKESPPEAERPTGRGLQLKQTSPAMEQAGAINLQPVKEFLDKAAEPVGKAINFVKEVGKEVSGPGKMTDYRRSVLNWSAKLQRSFGEAASIQRDITKQVKDPIRRDAISNWIQANGDPKVLSDRAALSEGKLAKGYEAALTLTPEELKIANQTKQRYDALAKRGQRYDVLDTLKDNYVTQIWDLGKGPTGSAMGRTLKQKFRFSKARTFDSFFAGEQADFVPKTKDISKLLPVYMHEMESVIAARELVEDMSKGTASDGRPLVASKGVGIPVDNPGADKATLVMPKIPTGDTKDYKVLPNQPALENWKWVSKDDQGNPIFLKADLALHPEAYNKLKNVLGKSAIKEWYQTPTSAVMAIPKAIVKGLDMANSEVKKTMLGVLSPFHQVQEATHAAGHRVNPTFSIPKIDLVRDAGQMDAARHGLMLQPDKASENQFMEGFKQSKIISKIPGLGPASDFYSNYLFNEYIPGLKYKTYSAILDRNTKLYAKDVTAGKVGIEDVKVLSAEQANAAFGHLNYADLGRNPTIQHIAQLGILAPDFFESRIRFAGQAAKGATGLKVGREQLLALATLALGQAALAYTSAKLTGGQWDEKRPFEMTLNGKRYTLRSVPEDMQKFMSDPRQFLHNRLSILGKGALQYSSGVNYKGQKVTAGETTKELAQQPIPLMARGFMHIGELSGWDQLLGAVGLKVSKASPRSDIMQQAHDWGINSTNPKVKAEYERRAKETLPDSVYKPLRQSLESGDNAKIVQNVKDILAVEPDLASKEKRMKQILKEFEPFSQKDLKPFATHSKENEVKFLHSLDPAGKAAYRQAIKEQVEQYRRLTKAIYGRERNPPIPEQYREVYGK